ncbi:MAG: phosphatase PAP2 family protein [Candidatus Lokiarchaeota archaeon]|nr:phosphatase PAP2 family protein [Candidatus Lokiarchaeota archaeon]MBD3202199.1 phosphatase PAP2 family protein [Candidatus Lokiarchaeota archaeon]
MEIASVASFKTILKKLETWDWELFLDLYESKFSHKKLVITFAKIYSFFGNIYFWGLVWLVLGVYGFFTKDYLLFILITGGFQQSIILHIIVRYIIVKRNRPFITLKERGVIQKDDLIGENKSFPSGHVTFFVFFGCIFAFHFNSWLLFGIFLLLGIIMALTRVILGVHFPIDVIFGFIFGIVFALLYLGLTYEYWLDFYYWLGRTFSPF